MSRNDQVLERLRAADPAPDTARIDPDELSIIFSLLEERREAMTTQTPIRPQHPTTERNQWLRPALAFGVALVIIVIAVGVGIFLFGDGGEQVITPSETSLPTPTSTPAPTSTPTTQASEPEGPTTVPVTEAPIFETVLNYKVRFMEAIQGSDNRALFLGWVETDPVTSTGTVQLLRCSDEACADPPEEVALAVGAGWQGLGLGITIGPEGYPVIGYQSESTPWIVYCEDPGCVDFTAYEAGSTAYHVFVTDGWAFGQDGLPLFLYGAGPGTARTNNLYSCHDPGCLTGVAVEIDSAPFMGGGAVLVDEDGILMAYTADFPTGPPGPEGGWDEAPMRHEVRVAFCEDAACLDGPVVTVLGAGWGNEIWEDLSGATHVRHVSSLVDVLEGRPFTYVNVSCQDAACSTFATTTSGPATGHPSLGSMITVDDRRAWPAAEPLFEPGMVDSEEGPVAGQVEVGTRLWFNECADPDCFAINSIDLGIVEDSDYWVSADVLVIAGEPVVAYNGMDGIHILRPYAK